MLDSLFIYYEFNYLCISDCRWIPWHRTVKPLQMCWLLLILFEEIRRFIQDASIFWDEKVGVSFMNLQLLAIKEEKNRREQS